MVYAVGTPRDGSMRVITHAATLASDGTVSPATIESGSEGLVRRPVTSFGTTAARADAAAPSLLSVGPGARTWW